MRRNSSRVGRFVVSMITSSSVFAASAARNPATSHARFTARLVICTTNDSFFAISSASASVASSSSSRGTTRFTSPIRSASSATPVLAGEQELLGLAHAHHPGQEHRHDPRAEPDVDVAELRVVGHDREVAREHQVGPAGQAIRTGPTRSPAWGSRRSRASRARRSRGSRASARASSSPSSASSFRS